MFPWDEVSKSEAVFAKELWCRVYAAVIASEKESAETAVMQANEAVTRYIVAWNVPPQKEGS